MIKHNRITWLVLGNVAFITLSGCGGAGSQAILAPISGTDTAVAPAAVKGKTTTYNALGSRAATSSILTGAGLTLYEKNGGFYATFIPNEGGTLNGKSRSVSVITLNSVSATNQTVVAISGIADASGKVTSANGDTLTPDTSISQSGYNYVGIADSKTTAGTDSFTGLHVLGVATAVNDMPLTGKANYKGPAVVQGLTPTTSGYRKWTLSGASAKVFANFGSGKVNTTITGTAAPGVPLDKILVTGAVISGSGFSGGTVTTSLNGTDVTAAYSGPTTSSTYGQFYGYNKTGTGTLAGAGPAEVGGVIGTHGTSGGVGATYIAK